MAANRKIALRPHDNGHHDEARASAAISPGMAIQLAADGTVAANAAAGTVGPVRIAKEDTLQGRTVDDAYAAGDVVSYFYPLSGDHVNVLLADGQNITRGANLARGAGGTFTVAAGTEAQIDFQADETLDLTAAGANQLIRAVKI